MPSDDDLARSISELKDEFRSGLSSLKRELAQEHDAALKKLKTATASVPKFKKKGNENQFLLKSEVLEHVQSASSALQAFSPQVEKALEELKEGSNFSNPFGAVNWPKAHVLFACWQLLCLWQFRPFQESVPRPSDAVFS